jgi:hypothetical protein
MCRKLRLYDNDFRVCEDKVWKKNKRSEKWKRIDTLIPNNQGYINVGLTDDNNKRKIFKLHRLIYKAYHPEWNIDDTCQDNCIDHIDRDKTNNHIDNLRVVTKQENGFNRYAKGCYYNKPSKKWRAQIRLNGKDKHLGCYETEEEAHQAYIEAKSRIHIIKIKNQETQGN